MNEELRAAFARLDAALAEARAALEKPEQEQPIVEVVRSRFGAGAGKTVRLVKITRLENALGTDHLTAYVEGVDACGPDRCVYATATPFSIWQECVKKGVPCCDPPRIWLEHAHGNFPREFIAVEHIDVNDKGLTRVHGYGRMPNSNSDTRDWYLGCWIETVTTPAAIRAACAEKGVPCVADEKPREVVVQGDLGPVRFTAVADIRAQVNSVGSAVLCVDGACGTAAECTETRTPIADIRKQAAEAADIKLPPVTVRIGDNTYTGIKQVRCEWCDIMHEPATSFVADDGEVYGTAECTPAQVCQLCALAGWPRPDVRCVFTYADGSPCDVDPSNVRHVSRSQHKHATFIEISAPLADGHCLHYVREPVAQVETMLAACKEGE